MSEHQDEWTRWGETWRSGAQTDGGLDIGALHARLRRARRLAAFVVASEAAVGLGALWFAIRFLRSDDPNDRMIGVAVTVFAVIVWALALWARRGSFADAGASVLETLERAIRHGETRVRVCTATYGAVATALAFLCALVFLNGPAPVRTIALPVGVAVAALIVVVAVTVWRDRRNRAELERLRRIHETMREKASDADERASA